MKKITIGEYCTLAKVTRPAVSYRITNGLVLPGIASYTYNKDKRCYELTPDKNIDTSNIENLFRSH